MRKLGLILVILSLAAGWAGADANQSAPVRESTYDLVIYGGTTAGVIAAVQASRWASPPSSSARTNTWAGFPAAAWASPTPATRRSSAACRASSTSASGRHYDQPGRLDDGRRREDYGNKGQGTPAIDGDAAHHVDFRAARGRAGLRGFHPGIPNPGPSRRMAGPRDRA